jgi:anti-sigma regulatory factor (Ser/Thr protein kinase)
MSSDKKNAGVFTLEFSVNGMDFAAAGDVASTIKRTLQQLGLDPSVVRRAAVAAFEAETNIVIHAYRGSMRLNVSTRGVEIVAEDEGPGIADIDLAMQDGFSTAPQHVREMGFGAGMGLPNIKRCSDELEIESTVGVGTKLRAFISSP